MANAATTKDHLVLEVTLVCENARMRAVLILTAVAGVRVVVQDGVRAEQHDAVVAERRNQPHDPQLHRHPPVLPAQ